MGRATGNYRIRLATDDERIARARRSASVGAWLVEAECTFMHYADRFIWCAVSSHSTERGATAKLARLRRK